LKVAAAVFLHGRSLPGAKQQHASRKREDKNITDDTEGNNTKVQIGYVTKETAEKTGGHFTGRNSKRTLRFIHTQSSSVNQIFETCIGKRNTTVEL